MKLARRILIIFVVFLLVCPTAVLASNFFRSYQIRGNTEGYGVYPSADGGYYFTGTTINLGIPLNPNSFVIKADSNGQPQWVKLINCPDQLSDPMMPKNGSDYGVAVTELSDGSIIAAGKSGGFSTDENQAKMESPVNILLSKFDPGGNHIWSKTIGNLGEDYPLALCPTPDNQFFLMGNTTRVYGFPAEQGYDYSDADKFRILEKYDGDGKSLWQKKTSVKFYSISGIEQTSLFLDSENCVPIIAYGDYPNPYTPAQKNDLVSLLKVDKEGNLVWIKSLESKPIKLADGKSLRFPYAVFKSAVPTSDGGYLALGLSCPLVDNKPQIDKQGHICSEIIAVKMDRQGNLLWVKGLKIGPFILGTNWREIYVASLKEGSFAFMGNFLPDVELAMQPAKEKAAKTKEHEQTSDFYMRNNIMVVRVDANLNPLWVKTLGGKKDVIGNDIKATPDGGLLIGGTGKAAGVNYGVLIKLGPQGEIDDPTLGADFGTIEPEDLSGKIVLGDVDCPLEDLTIPTQDRKPKVYTKPVQVW